jgi:transposase-like protein
MNHRKLNKRREFSEQIRRKAVTDFRSGTYTAQELADSYHCSPQTIYNWIYKYSPGDSPQINVVEMSESTDQKVKDLHDKIAQLERALGQKQIKVDFLEKMIDLAEDEYNLDVKKSSSSKRSSGSGRTDK